VKTLAPQHPEWRTKEPFASLLQGNVKAALAGGEKGLLEMLAATHTGMTIEEFSQAVADWLATARHPKTGRPYTEMVYQPMLELLAYLRANGFKTYIVSGGVVEFMRPWTEKTYGIPPEQVIGSYVKLAFEMRNGTPALLKLPEVGLVDDKKGKPVGIQTFIGRRPIAAFGTPMATCRCCSGPWPEPERAPHCSCTIRTPRASGPTTASPRSGSSTRASMRRTPAAGRSWI